MPRTKKTDEMLTTLLTTLIGVERRVRIGCSLGRPCVVESPASP